MKVCYKKTLELCIQWHNIILYKATTGMASFIPGFNYIAHSLSSERRYDPEREAQKQLAQKRKQLAAIEEEEKGQGN